MKKIRPYERIFLVFMPLNYERKSPSAASGQSLSLLRRFFLRKMSSHEGLPLLYRKRSRFASAIRAGRQWGAEPRAPCGVYFPVCGVKEPLGIRQYSEEPFPCLRKNILPHGPKEFKASEIFLRQGKKRRKAGAFRAFLTKHRGNFAALNRRVVRLPIA